MAWLHYLLLVELVWTLLPRDRITSAHEGDSRRLIGVAAILPDSAGRRPSAWRASWPFSIQNVSPAIDVALGHVNNERIAFDVK